MFRDIISIKNHQWYWPSAVIVHSIYEKPFHVFSPFLCCFISKSKFALAPLSVIRTSTIIEFILLNNNHINSNISEFQTITNSHKCPKLLVTLISITNSKWSMPVQNTDMKWFSKHQLHILVKAPNNLFIKFRTKKKNIQSMCIVIKNLPWYLWCTCSCLHRDYGLNHEGWHWVSQGWTDVLR